MREIKVRVWDNNFSLFIYLNVSNPSQADLYGFEKFQKIEKQQFTGLLDKDGKEIYEGDILRHYQSLHVIRWDEHIAGFSWRTCSMDIYLMFRKFVAENCEVVGNIYENEELLEAVK